MSLTRQSQILKAWSHPVGHDLLQALMKNKGYDLNWPGGMVLGRMPISVLDHIGSKNFTDLLLDLTNQNIDLPQEQPTYEQEVWWKEAVVYQIFLPSFMDSDHDGMGDLAGVRQRLPYLEKLGVNTIWLWSLLDSPAAYERGMRDQYAVMRDFGGMNEFEELVDAIHTRGMKLIIGVDITSTSDEHQWFKQALAHPKEKYAGYYILKEGSSLEPPAAVPGENIWAWYPELDAWALRLQGKHRINLNWDNPDVQQEMQKLLQFWLDKGVDGFSFASVDLLGQSFSEEKSEPLKAASMYGLTRWYSERIHGKLRELRKYTQDALVMGEARGIGTEGSKLFCGSERKELDMVLNPVRLSKIRNRFEINTSLQDIKINYLNWLEQYDTSYWMPVVLNSAELPRMVSRVGASAIYKGMVAKLLATVLLTLRGTPVIYQGDELGISNTRFASIEEMPSSAARTLYGELEKKQQKDSFARVLKVAPDHARTPMPWSGGAGGGFTGAEPWMRLPDDVEHTNATVQMENKASVWSYYRKLIELRKESACLVYGRLNPVFVKNKNVFCYFRILENEKWYIEMNITEREVGRPGRILPTQHLVLSNYDTQARTLRPYEANIYRCG